MTTGTAASAQNYPPTTAPTTTTTTTTTLPSGTTTTTLPGGTTTTTLPGGTTTTTLQGGTTTTSPGGTTTTSAPGEEGPAVRSFGAIRPGESFNKVDCGFRPGASADLRFNGNAAGTATVGADGCVRLRVEVVTETQVRIDGRSYSTVCGSQAIDVISVAPSGARRTAVNRFTIPCGSDRARGGTLTRTGADVLRWGAVALGLIAIGVAFVLADRRRHRRSDGLA